MGDEFGFVVQMSSDGSRVAISAPGDDPTESDYEGYVDVYQLEDDGSTKEWTLLGQSIKSTTIPDYGDFYEA